MKKRRKERPWRERTARDELIVRIMGWGPMARVARGYDVRFPKRYGGQRRYYSIQKYGNDRALWLARQYRDDLLKALNAPPRRRSRRRRSFAAFEVTKRRNNKSGAVGVAFDKKGDWVAYYHPVPRKQVRRAWSIKRYGNEGARMLAIIWRNEMINELRGAT